MKVLFARVGFMKFYQGPKPGDEKPIGGGAYNTDEIGHEAYNFLESNHDVYGYFQPHMKAPFEINLSRIEKNFTGNEIDNVLVIWFATNPIDRGQVIVGWYKNATVFKSIQMSSNLPQRENYNFNVKALKKDSVLLPLSNRKFSVGHRIPNEKKGNPGQANAFYILDKKGEEKDTTLSTNSWINSAIKYVINYDGASISTLDDEIQENILTLEHSIGNQGFQSDIVARLMVEAYAMKRCEEYYRTKGYAVKDVSATHSCDFIVEKSSKKLFVEVKGTQSLGQKIILTKNEVALSLDESHEMELFLVHSIVLNKKSVKNDSGKILIVKPWKVDESKLTPISYTYDLSSGDDKP